MSRRRRALFGLATALLAVTILELGVRLVAGARLEQPTLARLQAIRLHAALTQPALAVDARRPGDPPGARAYVPAMRDYRPSRVLMPKPTGVHRVFLLGDSVAWGMIAGHSPAISGARSLGAHLQRLLLEARGPEVELVNLGQPGFVSDIVLHQLQQVLSLSPDAIVIYVGINDANQDLVRSALEPGFQDKSWLRHHLRLVDLIAGLITRPTTRETIVPRDVELAANLGQALELTRRGGVPTFVCEPLSKDPETLGELRLLVRRVARQHGAVPVDLRGPFLRAGAKRDGGVYSLFSDNVHPTEEGYLVMAQAIADSMSRGAKR